MAIYERMTVKGRGTVLPQYQSNMGPATPGSGVTARFDTADARIMGAASSAYQQATGNLGNAIRKGALQVEGAYLDYSKSKATQLLNEYRSNMKHVLSGEMSLYGLQDIADAVVCAAGQDDDALLGAEESMQVFQFQ